MDTAELANWATVVAGFAAVLTLGYAVLQLRQNTSIARAQFWIELEKLFSLHDEVHLKLRPGGEWAGNSGGPLSVDEWMKVEDYMGLFEHCEIMLERRLLDTQTFGEIYAYRLRNLLRNSVIVETKLVGKREHWTRFLSLVNRMQLDQYITDRERIRRTG